MNTIQELISELEAEKSNADQAAKDFDHNPYIRYGEERASQAFDLCIQKLTLLLNTEKEKQQ